MTTKMWILLRLLLVLVIARAVWCLVVGIIQGLAGTDRRPPPEKSFPLVRDPVCGTFVVPSRALVTNGRDGPKYFCSERCRQAYAAMKQVEVSRR